MPLYLIGATFFHSDQSKIATAVDIKEAPDLETAKTEALAVWMKQVPDFGISFDNVVGEEVFTDQVMAARLRPPLNSSTVETKTEEA